MFQNLSPLNSSHAARFARIVAPTLVLVIVGGMAARQLLSVPTPASSTLYSATVAPVPIATSYDPCSTGVDGLFWSSDSHYVEGVAFNNAIDGCPNIAHFFKSDGIKVELTEAQRALSFDPPYRLNAANEPFMGLDSRDGRTIKLQSKRRFQNGFDHDEGLRWLIDGETLSPDAREFYAVYDGVFYAWQCESGKLLRQARLFTPEDSVGDHIELSSNGKRALWERLDGQRRVRLLDTRNGAVLHNFDGDASFADDGRLVWSERKHGTTQNRRNLLKVRNENGRALWSREFGFTKQFTVSAMGERLWVWRSSTVTFYNARNGLASKRLQVDKSLRSFVPSPDQSQAWGLTRNGEIRRYKLQLPPK